MLVGRLDGIGALSCFLGTRSLMCWSKIELKSSVDGSSVGRAPRGDAGLGRRLVPRGEVAPAGHHIVSVSLEGSGGGGGDSGGSGGGGVRSSRSGRSSSSNSGSVTDRRCGRGTHHTGGLVMVVLVGHGGCGSRRISSRGS